MPGEYSSEHIPPSEYVKELVVHSPEIHIGKNVSDEIILIRKLTSDGSKYERRVTSPKITDYAVSYWIIYSRWGKIP